MSRIVNLDEFYTWLPKSDQEQARTFMVNEQELNKLWYKNHSHKPECKDIKLSPHYAEIPDEMYERLEAALKAVEAIAAEIDAMY